MANCPTTSAASTARSDPLSTACGVIKPSMARTTGSSGTKALHAVSRASSTGTAIPVTSCSGSRSEIRSRWRYSIHARRRASSRVTQGKLAAIERHVRRAAETHPRAPAHRPRRIQRRRAGRLGLGNIGSSRASPNASTSCLRSAVIGSSPGSLDAVPGGRGRTKSLATISMVMMCKACVGVIWSLLRLDGHVDEERGGQKSVPRIVLGDYATSVRLLRGRPASPPRNRSCHIPRALSPRSGIDDQPRIPG